MGPTGRGFLYAVAIYGVAFGAVGGAALVHAWYGDDGVVVVFLAASFLVVWATASGVLKLKQEDDE